MARGKDQVQHQSGPDGIVIIKRLPLILHRRINHLNHHGSGLFHLPINQVCFYTLSLNQRVDDFFGVIHASTRHH